MALKKRPKRKKTGRKKKKASLFTGNLFKAVVVLSVLVGIVVAAGVAARHFLGAPPRLPEETAAVKKPVPRPPARPPEKAPQQVPAKKSRPPQSAAARVPIYEIFPDRDIPPSRGPFKNPDLKKEALPSVAIIIDDLGYDPKKAARFISLATPLTFSVLPDTPYFETIVRKARDREREVILHLPMEPKEYPEINPGPGALLASMTPDQMIGQLNRHIDALGYVSGVNNHMGSRLTADASRMNQIFTVLKKRRLYFIDSRTSAASKAYSAARMLQVPFAQRDVFLDHEQNDRFIKDQLERLIRIAQKDGSAIGIGHPHKLTYDVLKKELPNLQRRVRIVPASQLVFVPNYS